jgi:ribonuclease P protein component
VLAKKHRFSKQKDIQKVFRSKFVSRTDDFKIFLTLDTNSQAFKFLVFVPKKVSKKATERHRIKRKVMAAIKLIVKNSNIPASVSCIIQITNKNLLYKKVNSLYENLNTLLGKQFFAACKRNYSKPSTLKPS